MTPTPELPQYLVDAAERYDNATDADDETKREALAVLKAAITQAHVDLYAEDTTTLKEAA